jgi:hypothetical protein
MPKTYFCVADVHSFYTEMQRALSEQGYDENNPSHIFCSIGDLFDRGPESKECLEFVNSIPRERKILIRGNHEILMRQMVFGGNWPRGIDKHNGTWKTACDLTGVDKAEVMEKMRKNSEFWKYYHDTEYYRIVGDFVLTHAWVPCRRDWWTGEIKATPIEELDKEMDYDWENTFTWTNGMHAWSMGARIEGKTIICGHWNASWGWKEIRHKCVDLYDGDAIHEPFIDDGIVALDACTVVSKKVNCYKFTIEE